MDDTVTGQVTNDAAEFYEKHFVPALFQQWVTSVADAAYLHEGDHTLDVACGTGVLAREAAKRVLPGGSVTGVDRNEGMITTARARAPKLEWRIALAESLPFEDRSFDAVISQFGLMFFEDRAKAVTEMWRVLRPKGRLAVAVWDTLKNMVGWALLSDVLEQLFDKRIASELRVPFNLGDTGVLSALFEEAGVSGIDVRTVKLNVTFPSVADWVRLEVDGWTLGKVLGADQVQHLVTEAERVLAPHVLDDGRCSFPAAAKIVVASK